MGKDAPVGRLPFGRLTVGWRDAALAGAAGCLFAAGVVLRSGALVGVSAIGVALMLVERFTPLRPSGLLHAAWRSDTVHLVVNKTLTALVVGSFASVVGVALRGLVPWEVRHAVGSQPGWVQLIETLLIAEVIGYWVHRAMHTQPLLWRFHRVHHSIEVMNWLSGQRAHPMEMALTRLSYGIPVLALGFSVPTFVFVFGFLEFVGIFVHVNSRLTFGPLRWIFVTPEFHHRHHANDGGPIAQNLAGKFVFIDKVFGTYAQPRAARVDGQLVDGGKLLAQWPETYGIDEPAPSGYLRQLVWPVADLHLPRRVAASARTELPGATA